jgi:sugar phosphate permease
MIDGFASLGSVLGQLVVAKFKTWYGWRGTMMALTIFTAVSGIPTLSFFKFEYQRYKERKME